MISVFSSNFFPKFHTLACRLAGWPFLIITSVLFALSPYNFGASQTGLVSIGPAVTSALDMCIYGGICEIIISLFAKQNDGVYEPESGPYLMLLVLILQACGFGLWTVMQSRNVHWIRAVHRNRIRLRPYNVR